MMQHIKIWRDAATGITRTPGTVTRRGVVVCKGLTSQVKRDAPEVLTFGRHRSLGQPSPGAAGRG
ncbi:hypothetical protein E2C01_083628 [Portunus trituberculatus]|uniref:Uncharacterized protein n=1 Tax=Portunus trituberculatus TaxID=210409 RepID=A0A5B7J288_PORTR|nr:hypothetical protein [Portunus trituberculatus]